MSAMLFVAQLHEGQTDLMTAMLTGAYVLARCVSVSAMVAAARMLLLVWRCIREDVGRLSPKGGPMFLDDCCFRQVD